MRDLGRLVVVASFVVIFATPLAAQRGVAPAPLIYDKYVMVTSPISIRATGRAPRSSGRQLSATCTSCVESCRLTTSFVSSVTTDLFARARSVLFLL